MEGCSSTYNPCYVHIRKISETNTDDDDTTENSNSSPDSEKRISSVTDTLAHAPFSQSSDYEYRPYTSCTTFGKDGGCFKINRPKVDLNLDPISTHALPRRGNEDVYAVSYKKRGTLK